VLRRDLRVRLGCPEQQVLQALELREKLAQRERKDRLAHRPGTRATRATLEPRETREQGSQVLPGKPELLVLLALLVPRASLDLPAQLVLPVLQAQPELLVADQPDQPELLEKMVLRDQPEVRDQPEPLVVEKPELPEKMVLLE
jgi:hypothetical protein